MSRHERRARARAIGARIAGVEMQRAALGAQLLEQVRTMRADASESPAEQLAAIAPVLENLESNALYSLVAEEAIAELHGWRADIERRQGLH